MAKKKSRKSPGGKGNNGDGAKKIPSKLPVTEPPSAARDPEQSPGTTEKQRKGDYFPIVGIGASAGGLAALKTFFAKVPHDSGMAFVVVVHLSPDHKSHLAELLQPHVQMPVQQVNETMKLQRNCVYVIPPNANLDTIDTHLRLSALEERRQERAPIDHFFRTLAKTHDGEAIGIILTGTGSDGTLGIREIKEAGGLSLVQDPNEAEYDGMPQSAIATGMIDLVLPLEEIPDAIARIVRTRPRVPDVKDGEDLPGDSRILLQKVFAQLRARTGRDFSRYKPATIIRRIERRMQLRHVEDMPQYLEILRKHPDEVVGLGDDLLITVTSFFRDREVFEKLEQIVIPDLVSRRRGTEEIRIWSVGCATGEEAFSLAMLLLEEIARQETSPHIQIFASDLHEHSLRKAREGFYPGDIEADVSAERLAKFFLKENGGYRIRKEVREVVVFAPHNLMGDPPFSRLDMISCRNVLIYLQRDVQRDIIELFHYSLKPDGWLVLGTSENIDAGDLFRIEDKRASLYRKRNVPPREPRLPVFPLTHHRLAVQASQQDPARPAIDDEALHTRLLEQYGPASVLVGPDDKILHLSDKAGRYFVNPRGKPTDQIFKLIRTELQFELRSALHEARRENEPVDCRPIRVRFNGESGTVRMSVRPASDLDQTGFVLLIFQEDHALEAPEVSEEPPRGVELGDHSRLEQLEAENEQIRQRLQAIIEEYETSREEMKAANEELQSTNEELRSTMEELETSKEELQSMNEELQTVNQENRHKVEELSQLSGDLQNLMAATDIATLFLDRELRILRFTPKINDLFNVRATDRGRPLADLTSRSGYGQLIPDARRVLSDLNAIEREVEDEEGRWHLTRIIPYRSSDDRILGIVVTFVDITNRKIAEDKLRAHQKLLAEELEGLVTLNELGAAALRSDRIEELTERTLDTALTVMKADFASLQKLRPSRESGDKNLLELLASRNFHPRSAEFWREVDVDDLSTCAEVLRTGRPYQIEDVEEETRAIDRDNLAEFRRSGIRAVQSMPLMGRSGRLLGVISTHWRKANRAKESELYALSIAARMTADAIERIEREDALRAGQVQLEHRVAERTAQLANRNTQLQSLSHQLTEIEQRERKKLATTLHDGLQQILIAARIAIENVEGPDVQAGLAQASRILNEAIDVTRTLSHELYPPVLQDSPVCEALRWLALWFESHHRLHVELSLVDSNLYPQQPTRDFLLNATRELLLNVLKHSGQDKALLELRQPSPKQIQIVVLDAGGGFDVNELEKLADRGLGILSLRERASALGGAFTIRSTPGEGTRVEVTVPFAS